MPADDWERLRDLFHAALERSGDERSAFLDEACGGDARVRAQIEAMVEAHEQTASLIKPAVSRAGSGDGDPATGLRIGRYEVRSTIASGGMGTVYEAIQDHPHRLVALKVLRRGAASRQALKRFRYESEILGRLRHPNIAQVYDAGTYDEGEGGQPYFAMELVKGRRLLQFCAAEDLSTRKRLEIFAKVCDAVQFAHHKGVIHRDLKPDNILVDDFGEPKILDFGVARATDSDIQATTLQTDIGQLIGTVPYMSPEQVAGDPAELDTRSDVYSLGVVLYELLADRLPHDLREKSIPEAVRIIGEQDPTPLSSISRIYRGDLDTITSKALEKEKNRRYQTATELAADIRHYLADEPVVARPASTFYKLRKFSRRNRAVVAGVAAVFVVLVAGTTASTMFAIGQTREARKATEISDYFRWVLSLINPNEEGGTTPTPARVHTRATTLNGLLDVAGEQIDSMLADWPLEQAELHVRFGHTYFGLLDRTTAVFHFERAYELYREHLGENHHETFVTLCLLGWTQSKQGRYDEAYRMLQEAWDGLVSVAGPDHPDTLEARAQLGRHIGFKRWRHAHGEKMLRETLAKRQDLLTDRDPATITNAQKLVTLLVHAQQYQEAEKLARHWLDISRSELSDEHFRTADLLTNLGEILLRTGRSSEAEPLLREAYDTMKLRMGLPTARTSVAAMRLGQALNAVGRLDDAERELRDLAEATRAELGDNNIATWLAHYRLGFILLDQPGRLGDVAQIMTEAFDGCSRIQGEQTWVSLTMSYKLGSVLRRNRQFDKARSRLQWTLEQQRMLHGPDAMEVMVTVDELALLAEAQGDLEGAERLYRKSLDGRTRSVGADQMITLRAASAFGGFLRRRGPSRYVDAQALLQATLDKQREIFDDGHGAVLLTMHRLGVVMADRGDPRAGAAWLWKALEGRIRLYGETHRVTLLSMFTLAGIQQRAGELDDAEDLYRRVLAGRQSTFGGTHPATLDAMNSLAWFLKDRGTEKAAQAEDLARQAIELLATARGETHADTLNARDTLGVILRTQGKLGTATSHFRELVAAVEDALEREHWLTPIVWAHYGLCLLDQDPEQAEALLSAAFPRLQAARGDDDDETHAVREALDKLRERTTP
jgi:non-specific serine/threonine protein kinase/serine/threonine-protein kinase